VEGVAGARPKKSRRCVLGRVRYSEGFRRQAIGMGYKLEDVTNVPLVPRVSLGSLWRSFCEYRMLCPPPSGSAWYFDPSLCVMVYDCEPNLT